MKPPKPRPYSDPRRPLINYVVETKLDKKRVRRFFPTKKAANFFCQTLENDRVNLGLSDASVLTEAAKREAAEAIRQLADVNATLTDAVSYYLRHVAARKRSKDISEAIDEWIALRKSDDSIRERTIGNLVNRMAIIQAEFAGRLVAEVSTSDLTGWLEGIKAGGQTKKHYRGMARAFFNWAQLRGLCDFNPVNSIPAPVVKKADPLVFTPLQMATMMMVAQKKDPRLLGWLVLGGFAGIRAEEISRLRWEDISFSGKNIDIRPEVSKTGSGRDVVLEPNAAEWLHPIKDEGTIVPSGWLGKHVVREFKAALSTEGVLGVDFKWPQNGLRHSFASYHLYRGQDAGKTALQLGHNGNPSMLFRHYRRRVKPEVAEEWFKITPAKGGNENG